MRMCNICRACSDTEHLYSRRLRSRCEWVNSYCKLLSSCSAQASSLVDETKLGSSMGGAAFFSGSGSGAGAGGCSCAGEKSFARLRSALQSGHVPSAASPPCTQAHTAA